jgi:HSP20 family protein
MSRFSSTLLPVRPKVKSRSLPVSKPYLLDEFRNELETMFHKFWGGWLTPFGEDFGTFKFWDFDMSETEKEFAIKAELPGFDGKDLDIQLCENLLFIKAEKEEKNEENYTSYRRTLLLPYAIDPNRVKASYRNGVLEVHIPKPEEAKMKHIPIRAE